MSAHTTESVLAEFTDENAPVSPQRRAINLASALADARNTIEDQRREIQDLSVFTQIARDAARDLTDGPSPVVVLARAEAELARLRPIVEAARDFYDDFAKEEIANMCTSLRRLWLKLDDDAVRAADATHCPRCHQPTQRDDAHTCAVQRGARE